MSQRLQNTKSYGATAATPPSPPPPPPAKAPTAFSYSANATQCNTESSSVAGAGAASASPPARASSRPRESTFHIQNGVREHAAREVLDVAASSSAPRSPHNAARATCETRTTNANNCSGKNLFFPSASSQSVPLVQHPQHIAAVSALSTTSSSAPTSVPLSPSASHVRKHQDEDTGGEGEMLVVGDVPLGKSSRSSNHHHCHHHSKHPTRTHKQLHPSMVSADGDAAVEGADDEPALHSRWNAKKGSGDTEGKAVVVEDDPENSDGSDDACARWMAGLPFIGNACARFMAAAERAVPPGGHLSNIFNMASNTLGIGIVSMASGFNTTGIGLAVILMVVCAVLVVFSFYLIGVTCERSPYRSWESACRGILFRGADQCVAYVMIFFQFGTMVGFVTAAHDLIGPFIATPPSSGTTAADDGSHTSHAALQRVITVVVWFFGMLPLCLPRRVASLRYFSIVGVTLVIFFVFAVVAHSCMAGLPHVHDMKIFASGLDAVNGLTLFIFAFLGHGLCFRLFDEMQQPSAGNLLRDGCGSVSLIGVLYFIVGFFGYAEFGLNMTGSIFKYYEVRNEPMMCVAYIGILLKICVAYALSGQACRLPVYYILKKDIDTSSYPLHLYITIPLCVGSLIMGMLVPDINIVFNLLGSICGGILAFLLPAFFVMYIGGWTVSRVGWFRLGMTYLNIVAGVVAIVFGTAVTIDGLVH